MNLPSESLPVSPAVQARLREVGMVRAYRLRFPLDVVNPLRDHDGGAVGVTVSAESMVVMFGELPPVPPDEYVVEMPTLPQPPPRPEPWPMPDLDVDPRLWGPRVKATLKRRKLERRLPRRYEPPDRTVADGWVVEVEIQHPTPLAGLPDPFQFRAYRAELLHMVRRFPCVIASPELPWLSFRWGRTEALLKVDLWAVPYDGRRLIGPGVVKPIEAK